MDLDGASVLLTGGSRGLGPYIARALLARGARVVVSGPLAKIADVSIAMAPRLTEAIARRTGAYRIQRREADAQARRREG